ncbi:MAG TPA: tetratricopeptide repeat protein [Myxococcales bacterium]|nr:tetratricopeptide repeat protein [Myxococcales bacterium]
MAGPVPLTVVEKLIAEYGPALSDPSCRIDTMALHRISAQVKNALESTPPELRVHIYQLLGQVRWRLDDYEGALPAYRSAAYYGPEYGDPLSNMACCHMALGQFEQALECFRQALTKPVSGSVDSKTRILANQAEVYFKLGDRPSARRLINEALQGEPKLPVTWLILAMQAAIVDQPDDAVEFMARYISALRGREIGEEPAIEVLQTAPPEIITFMTEHAALAAAIRQVRERYDQPIPDDQQIATEIRLNQDGWTALENATREPA